jgi:hypothetical protein
MNGKERSSSKCGEKTTQDVFGYDKGDSLLPRRIVRFAVLEPFQKLPNTAISKQSVSARGKQLAFCNETVSRSHEHSNCTETNKHKLRKGVFVTNTHCHLIKNFKIDTLV